MYLHVAHVIHATRYMHTAGNRSAAYLAPSLATASEAHNGVGLHMGHDVLQVLHVGRVICPCHDLLVLGQLIPSAGGH